MHGKTVTWLDGLWQQRNTSNSITTMRFALVIPLGISAGGISAGFGWHWLAVLIIAIAGLTDYLDGQVARGWNECTPLGRVMDPLADKVFTDVAILAAAVAHGSVWLTCLWVVAVLYDVNNTWHRLPEIKLAILNQGASASDLPATLVSKSKTAVLFVIAAYSFLPPEFLSETILNLAVVLGITAVLTSWLNNRLK